MSFWKDLKKPFYCLAPMEDVTDTVFREVILSISNPKYLNVVFGEFTSTDGLCHPVGRDKVSHRLLINESEKKLLKEKNVKIIAQIWGSEPEKFFKSAKIIEKEYSFDGIDINMGCPVKKIVKQASCSELIKYPELAKEIIIATKEATNLPVSVKTRTGIKEHITEKWISNLIEAKPEAITLHARTQKMMSDYPAEWEQINIAVQTRNTLDKNILIIGNGDLFSIEECFEKINEYKIDGVMIGRGIFKNPYFFNYPKMGHNKSELLELMKKHLDLFIKTWGNEKNIQIMKKFFKIYTFGFYGAAELRARLMECHTYEEISTIIENEIKLQKIS